MFNFSRFAKSFLKVTTGSVGGAPRIHNLDTDAEVYGYCAIHDQASSSFSRIKVHRGWFACEPTEIRNGDLIEDRADSSRYFVMAVKREYNNDATVYLDGTLYYVDATVTISRFGGNTKDAFGRSTQNTAVVIATDVPVMTNPKNLESVQQPDAFVEKDEIHIYIQAKYGVQVADRLTSSTGDVYKVDTINKSSLTNIWICTVNKDNR